MAASGVNVKMGVSGVSQFKQDINTAKQAVKTLDAQLALCEKQFKVTGNEEAYLAEKAGLLQAKLNSQKSVLASIEKALKSMADNGVDKSSAAYQSMYRQMLDTKAAILETESAISGAEKTEKATAKSTNELNKQLKQIGKGVNLQNVTDGIEKIAKSMEKAAKKAVDLGKKITREVLGAGSWADDLATQAKYYGVDEEQLQRMQKTAALIDTPVDAIINARKRLKKETSAGKDDTMNTFAALGIDPSTAEDAEDLFWKVGEALMNLDDEFAKEEYAQKLLGRSWEELIPLFEAGREKYEQLNDSWSVVPQEQIDALKELDDQYQTLKNDLETVKMTFMGELAENLTPLMEKLTGLVGKLNEYLASPKGQETMRQLGDTITSLVTSLLNVDPDAIVNALAGAIDTVKSGLEWIKDNQDLVIGAIKAIGIAFAALKLGELATNVWKVVNGFKSLTGFGGGKGVDPTTGTPKTGTPTTGGNPTTAGGPATGWAAVKAGLGNAAMVGSELLVLATVADAVYDNIKYSAEGLEKSQKTIDKFTELSQKYGSEAWFSNISGLYGYQHISEAGQGSGEVFDAMDEFAKHWDEWWYDREEDPLLDRMAEIMDPESFDNFATAMEAYNNGEGFNRDEMYNDIEAGLDAMEQAAEELSRQRTESEEKHNGEVIEMLRELLKGNESSEDNLPERIGSAVGAAVKRQPVRVVVQLEGQTLMDYVDHGMGGRLGAMFG